VPDLYDAVALGMRAYAGAAFRLEVLAPARLALEPGTLIVATHRRESDVPVLAPPLYYRGRLRETEGEKLSFAARDDMFLPGFFAGFPPGLPRLARRLLYPVAIARWLPRVGVHPLRSANVARLGEVLAAHPAARLDELLADGALAALLERARAGGAARPQLARDVLRGEYADVLWRAVSPADVAPDRLAAFWSRRAGLAADDFRTLVELLRSGSRLVVFPEGRPSPAGEIGPLQRGIGALVRRGRPAKIQPLALAYDPLVRGRTRVFVSLPPPVDPPRDDVDLELLRHLRRAMPLTAGQFAADRLVEHAGFEGLDGDLAEAVAGARAEGRLVEPELLGAEGRRRRLGEALAVAPRRPSTEIGFLAREYRSAREPV
jgi:hypothetical protein